MALCVLLKHMDSKRFETETQLGVEFKPPISTELPRGIADGLVVLVPRKPRGVMRLGTWGLGSIPRPANEKCEGILLEAPSPSPAPGGTARSPLPLAITAIRLADTNGAPGREKLAGGKGRSQIRRKEERDARGSSRH
ncbi:T-box transcription factor TBX2-B, partial [Frankliniella fusca]